MMPRPRNLTRQQERVLSILRLAGMSRNALHAAKTGRTWKHVV